jgi:hypothetical protein
MLTERILLQTLLVIASLGAILLAQYQLRMAKQVSQAV